MPSGDARSAQGPRVWFSDGPLGAFFEGRGEAYGGSSRAPGDIVGCSREAKQSLSTVWTSLKGHVVSDPRAGDLEGLPLALFGQHFDPEPGSEPSRGIWRQWPERWLWVPTLLHYRRATRQGCLVHLAVHAGDDAEATLERAARTLCSRGPDPHHESGAAKLNGYDARHAWCELVQRARETIRGEKIDKIVLARATELPARPLTRENLREVLTELATRFADCAVFALQPRGDEAFLAATPESLVRQQGRELQTMALAGTLPAGASDDELAEILTSRWTQRDDRYSEQRVPAKISRRRKVEMYHIGG